MAKLSANQVPIQHISTLANLQLNDEQLQTYQKALAPILTHMQEVADMDLSKVPATARVMEEENILREDVVEESLTQEQALHNAKSTHDGFFMVNAIFEDKS